MMLSVHPIFLGGGLPCLKTWMKGKTFTYRDTITYPTGLVQLIYKK